MPHITVKMWPGKTEEQKKQLTELLVNDIMQVTGAPLDGVSVIIEDVEPEVWDAEVCKKELAPKKNLLYKAPGYPFE